MGNQPAGNVAELPVMSELAPTQDYATETAAAEDRGQSLIDRFVYSGFFPAQAVGVIALIAYANLAEAVGSIKESISR